MDPLLDFSNKVVLITGAAQGFGKLLAESFALRGAQLVISDIKQDAIESLAQTLSAKGAAVVGMPCDVSSSDDCKAMVEMAVKEFGRVDIAINNAGIAHDFTPLHKIEESLMDLQFNVNVKGVQFGMRHQITQMLTQGGGTILNVSSMAGMAGAPMLSAYGAAKHAVIGLTQSGAVEYARNNIRINAVCPFFALTPMVTNMSTEEMRGSMGQGAPMRRLAEPEEVVATMILMLSPANTFMTGQCIAIDGGVSAQ
jgi:NAD(P)-dependent dehydrogenase (short-subunit alcohol dehydrogenase family)